MCLCGPKYTPLLRLKWIPFSFTQNPYQMQTVLTTPAETLLQRLQVAENFETTYTVLMDKNENYTSLFLCISPAEKGESFSSRAFLCNSSNAGQVCASMTA